MSAIAHANPLTQLELDHLKEVREIWQVTQTAGWHRILGQMKAFVDEAHEDMFQALYASNDIKAALQNRWQQREAMLRGVEKYISDCEFERQQLLSESRSAPEPHGVPVEEYAERDQELAGW